MNKQCEIIFNKIKIFNNQKEYNIQDGGMKI